jgi:hypothetical protein
MKMNINKTIEILEALAAGFSPTTGEMVDKESILNEREVIRALQIAIDQLKKGYSQFQADIKIDEGDIKNVIQLFKEQDKNLSSNNLVGFFLGTRKFKNQIIVSNVLYGKFKNVYANGQLLDFFTQYLFDNNLASWNSLYNNSYREIDFFQKEKFNKLPERAINQLKEKIHELGILKTENLSDYIQTARIIHSRAYEHWSEKEMELLSKAIKYTNDLDLLSECFQRGKGSIESCGQKLIYESQNCVEKTN